MLVFDHTKSHQLHKRESSYTVRNSAASRVVGFSQEISENIYLSGNIAFSANNFLNRLDTPLFHFANCKALKNLQFYKGFYKFKIET